MAVSNAICVHAIASFTKDSEVHALCAAVFAIRWFSPPTDGLLAFVSILSRKNLLTIFILAVAFCHLAQRVAILHVNSARIGTFLNHAASISLQTKLAQKQLLAAPES
jgi:choline-glycine betaine transporter